METLNYPHVDDWKQIGGYIWAFYAYLFLEPAGIER
jgi:hypothetical protein